MGLFSKRRRRTSRRALRKAHTKTLQAQARAESKFRAKTSRKADKLAAKGGKVSRRTARAASKAQAKAVKAAAPLSAKVKAKNRVSSARSYVGVAQVVVPVVAPFAYRGVTALRGQLDAVRARRIGVGVEQLGEFSGHGASLSAQIAGLEPALAEMAGTHLGAEDVEFRARTTARLAELSTAVHAAERMPTPRRKAAHSAIAADLDRIDGDLLRRLGVH